MTMKKLSLIRICYLNFILFCCCSISVAQKLSIIPMPSQVQAGKGDYVITSNTIISIPSKNQDAAKVATYLSKTLAVSTGFDLKISESESKEIQLQINAKPNAVLGKEGYQLETSPTTITIQANTANGLFYGVQTLIQLLPKEVESKSPVSNIVWKVPSASITDYPRFTWRGIMLDVSRHFSTKETVKKYIDEMARYKYNRFHWHLTDDEGWRVEIKSYPKLTSVGAWRVPRVGDWGKFDKAGPGEAATDGGFYTQEDIKEIVQYAKDRFIEILPEVDVPGHSMAAIAAYPELCTTKDTSINVNPGSKFSNWFGNGKFEMTIDNTLNPTDEKVYQFLDKVFTEMAILFPFDYIHIGGDECYKGYWERDANTQAFMKKMKLKDGEALQNYFTKRVSDIVTSKKKKVIGWDEILEGGDLAPGAAVMSWRGTKGGIEAIHQKHPVVMSPSPMCYLDLYQGDPSVEPPTYSMARLKDTYAYEPIPEGADSTLVLGGQGNMWTERTPAKSQVEYMMYPRTFAVSELLWSAKRVKNWTNFVSRVENHFARFDEAQINYSSSLYDPIISVSKNSSGALVITLTTEVSNLDLYYTLDNTLPNKYYLKYKEPIVLSKGVDLFRVTSYRNGNAIGKMISLKTEDLEKRVKK
jgi:hexosaminidase